MPLQSTLVILKTMKKTRHINFSSGALPFDSITYKKCKTGAKPYFGHTYKCAENSQKAIWIKASDK